MINEKYVSERIASLRTSMNISARDMSLTLGQSPNYINNIENQKAMPSMSMFLYICDFFNITPKEFFDEDIKKPALIAELCDIASNLNSNQLEPLIEFLKNIDRSK